MFAKGAIHNIRRQLDAIDHADAAGCAHCPPEVFKVIDHGDREAAEADLPAPRPCLSPENCPRHVTRVIVHCHRPAGGPDPLEDEDQ